MFVAVRSSDYPRFSSPARLFLSVVDGKWRDGKYGCQSGDRAAAPGRAG